MSDNCTEVAELLKKVSAQLEFGNKLTKVSSVFVLITLVGAVGFAAYWHLSILQPLNAPKDDLIGWYDVQRAEGNGDPVKALRIADRILVLRPYDYDVHYLKGEILLKMGDIEGARESFQQASSIFPTPRNKVAVEALSGRQMGE